jgi:hypothetical protein
MTTEPAPVRPPGHPLPELATFELARYRRDLEHALAALPGPAPGGGCSRAARRGPGRAGLPHRDHHPQPPRIPAPALTSAPAFPAASGGQAAGPGGLSPHLDPNGI